MKKYKKKVHDKHEEYKRMKDAKMKFRQQRDQGRILREVVMEKVNMDVKLYGGDKKIFKLLHVMDEMFYEVEEQFLEVMPFNLRIKEGLEDYRRVAQGKKPQEFEPFELEYFMGATITELLEIERKIPKIKLQEKMRMVKTWRKFALKKSQREAIYDGLKRDDRFLWLLSPEISDKYHFGKNLESETLVVVKASSEVKRLKKQELEFVESIKPIQKLEQSKEDTFVVCLTESDQNDETIYDQIKAGKVTEGLLNSAKSMGYKLKKYIESKFPENEYKIEYLAKITVPKSKLNVQRDYVATIDTMKDFHTASIYHFGFSNSEFQQIEEKFSVEQGLVPVLAIKVTGVTRIPKQHRKVIESFLRGGGSKKRLEIREGQYKLDTVEIFCPSSAFCLTKCLNYLEVKNKAIPYLPNNRIADFIKAEKLVRAKYSNYSIICVNHVKENFNHAMVIKSKNSLTRKSINFIKDRKMQKEEAKVDKRIVEVDKWFNGSEDILYMKDTPNIDFSLIKNTVKKQPMKQIEQYEQDWINIVSMMNTDEYEQIFDTRMTQTQRKQVFKYFDKILQTDLTYTHVKHEDCPLPLGVLRRMKGPETTTVMTREEILENVTDTFIKKGRAVWFQDDETRRRHDREQQKLTRGGGNDQLPEPRPESPEEEDKQEEQPPRPETPEDEEKKENPRSKMRIFRCQEFEDLETDDTQNEPLGLMEIDVEIDDIPLDAWDTELEEPAQMETHDFPVKMEICYDTELDIGEKPSGACEIDQSFQSASVTSWNMIFESDQELCEPQISENELEPQEPEQVDEQVIDEPEQVDNVEEPEKMKMIDEPQECDEPLIGDFELSDIVVCDDHQEIDLQMYMSEIPHLDDPLTYTLDDEIPDTDRPIPAVQLDEPVPCEMAIIPEEQSSVEEEIKQLEVPQQVLYIDTTEPQSYNQNRKYGEEYSDVDNYQVVPYGYFDTIIEEEYYIGYSEITEITKQEPSDKIPRSRKDIQYAVDIETIQSISTPASLETLMVVFSPIKSVYPTYVFRYGKASQEYPVIAKTRVVEQKDEKVQVIEIEFMAAYIPDGKNKGQIVTTSGSRLIMEALRYMKYAVKSKVIRLYAHNGGKFDWQVIAKELCTEHHEFLIMNKNQHKFKFRREVITNGIIYKTDILLGRTRFVTHDSIRETAGSLENISKDLKCKWYKKQMLEYPQTLNDYWDVKEGYDIYNIYDGQVLAQIITKSKESSKTLPLENMVAPSGKYMVSQKQTKKPDSTLSVSAPGHSKRLYMEYLGYQQIEVNVIQDRFYQSIIRDALQGGQSRNFRNITKTGPDARIYDLDINSQYPAAMVLFQHRYVDESTARHMTLEEMEQYRQALNRGEKSDKIFVCYATIEINPHQFNQINSTKESGKTMFACGKITKWFISTMIENEIEQSVFEMSKNKNVRPCKVLRIMRGIIYDGFQDPQVFKYVNEMYEKKKVLAMDKGTPNFKPSQYDKVKVMMNGLYGKLCERQHPFKYVIRTHEEMQEEPLDIHETIVRCLSEGCLIRRECEEEINYDLPPIWAVQVLAFAKYILMKAMNSIGENIKEWRPLNIETDGWQTVIRNEEYDTLKELRLDLTQQGGPEQPLIGKELGQIGTISKPIVELYNRAPKDYIMVQESGRDVIKSKGMTLNPKPMTVEEIIEAYEIHENRQFDKIVGESKARLKILRDLDPQTELTYKQQYLLTGLNIQYQLHHVTRKDGGIILEKLIKIQGMENETGREKREDGWLYPKVIDQKPEQVFEGEFDENNNTPYIQTTLTNRVNLEELEALKEQYTQIVENNEASPDTKMDPKFIKKYLDDREQFEKVTYTQMTRHKGQLGRQYSKTWPSYQSLPKKVRNRLAKNMYDDWDMKNAHPTILLWIYQKTYKPEDTHHLAEYINNRNKYLFMYEHVLYKKPMTLKETQESRTFFKKYILQGINTDRHNLHLDNRFPILNELVLECKTNGQRYFDNPNKELYIPTTITRSINVISSFINKILLHYENDNLMKFKNMNNITEGILMFDGLMVPKGTQIKIPQSQQNIEWVCTPL